MERRRLVRTGGDIARGLFMKLDMAVGTLEWREITILLPAASTWHRGSYKESCARKESVPKGALREGLLELYLKLLGHGGGACAK